MGKIKGWDYKGVVKLNWYDSPIFANRWVSKGKVDLGKVTNHRDDMSCNWEMRMQVLVFRGFTATKGWAFNVMKHQDGGWKPYSVKDYKTKKEAMEQAIKYMRSHPNG